MAAKQLLFDVLPHARRCSAASNSSPKSSKSRSGPRVGDVVIDKEKFRSPTCVTKDGVTVAKEVELPDPYENMGAQMVKEVASKTSDAAGERHHHRHRSRRRHLSRGPSLRHRRLQPGFTWKAWHRQSPLEPPSPASPGFPEGQLTAEERPPGHHRLHANWLSTIGNIIADAMDKKVGKDEDGTITVEEAKSIETTLDVVEGMQFDKGYLSPYFATNAEAMEAVLEDAYMLVHEKEISQHLQEFLPAPDYSPKAASPSLSSPRKSRARRSPHWS